MDITTHWFDRRMQMFNLGNIRVLYNYRTEFGFGRDTVLAYCGKWSFTLDEFHWDNEEVFNTEREAVEAALEYYKDEDVDYFYVGRLGYPDAIFSIQDILIEIEENYYNQSGDYADGWLANISPRDSRDLKTRFGLVLKDWMEDTGNIPQFYTIKEVSRINRRNNFAVKR